MSPTLAEMRAQSGPTPLPKADRTVTLIEGQHLLADAERLNEERSDLQIAASREDEAGNPTGPPSKAGQGGKEARDRAARIAAIDTEMKTIVARLGEFQAEVGLVGLSGGDWQRFKDANPPREDSQQDLRLARGLCNSTAVFDDLGRYVKTWNGEDVAPDDWDKWLAERITYADRRDLVGEVVMMHEQGLARAPKSPAASSQTEISATD